ncbi:TrkA C-terminal domain-containing protein [Helicobacter sp. 23-1044]
MKSVLIIAEGGVAKIFLEFLAEKYQSNNNYTIISNDSEILAFGDRFHILRAEITSSFFLTPLISHKIHSIFVITQNPAKSNEVCHIIRQNAPEIPIVVFLKQKANLSQNLHNDANISIVSSDFLSAKSLIQQMPNIPVIARGFGLNKGEIMQIGVPFGSPYSHTSIGSILQKGWSIAGIYRGFNFLLPKDSTIILPNDSILAVGEPRILNKIYKRINNNKHSFPAPFGRDIFAYIDFRICDKDEIKGIIADALFLHKKIKNDNLIINILNPSDIAELREILRLQSDNIFVKIEYAKINIAQKIALDSAKKMGLIIAPSAIFKSKGNRKILFKANRPILKVGKVRLENIAKSLTITADSAQNIAYNIVDFSAQLNLNIMLYEFQIDGEFNENLAQYYRNLCKVLHKEICFERTNATNPLFWIYKTQILQFIPLEIDILKSRFSWILEKNANYLSLLIHKNPQILLPI